jgi:hypothetical protein
MTKPVHCSSCQAVIAPANIDRQRELATCGQCGRLIDLRQQPAAPGVAPDSSGQPRARASVMLPDGMSVTTTATEVVIRRRWLRPKHWFLLLLFASAAAYVGHLWATVGASAWLVVATLFAVSFNYNLLSMFVNGTAVIAGAHGVQVQHGPLPSPFAFKAAVKKSEIEQLYSAKHGALFSVQAKVKSGETLRLVAPLITAEQALFIEQQLERTLGLVDFAVEGELNDGRAVNVEGKRPTGTASAAALALIIPALIAGAIALIVMATSTEISGRLQASGSAGSWVFEPDDCTSGEREGFGGVVLTASALPARLVRIVQDPVRGNLVVLASQGQPNRVMDDKSCRRFDVQVQRTDTRINKIWAVDGRVAIECDELAGSVVFETCH